MTVILICIHVSKVEFTYIPLDFPGHYLGKVYYYEYTEFLVKVKTYLMKTPDNLTI